MTSITFDAFDRGGQPLVLRAQLETAYQACLDHADQYFAAPADWSETRAAPEAQVAGEVEIGAGKAWRLRLVEPRIWAFEEWQVPIEDKDGAAAQAGIETDGQSGNGDDLGGKWLPVAATVALSRQEAFEAFRVHNVRRGLFLGGYLVLRSN